MDASPQVGTLCSALKISSIRSAKRIDNMDTFVDITHFLQEQENKIASVWSLGWNSMLCVLIKGYKISIED